MAMAAKRKEPPAPMGPAANRKEPRVPSLMGWSLSEGTVVLVCGG